jgi:hypothetical protein
MLLQQVWHGKIFKCPLSPKAVSCKDLLTIPAIPTPFTPGRPIRSPLPFSLTAKTEGTCVLESLPTTSTNKESWKSERPKDLRQLGMSRRQKEESCVPRVDKGYRG